ncbi:MAG: VanZ family protein [Bacteroidales bacterium]|nr:VanZ family protein [Bacteroidales bacterium]
MNKKVLLKRILFLLYIAAVVWICIYHFRDLSRFPRIIWGIHSDKLVHFALFFPFPILAYLSYDKTKYNTGSSVLFIIATFILGFTVAGATEYIQRFLPYRTADYTDMRADILSIGISCLLVFIADLKDNARHRAGKIRRRKSHKRKH